MVARMASSHDVKTVRATPTTSTTGEGGLYASGTRESGARRTSRPTAFWPGQSVAAACSLRMTTGAPPLASASVK